MKFSVQIAKITTVNEILDYWTPKDYIELLDRFEFSDAESLPKEELREMLFMAITDFEPDEAAAILLDYKLSDHLSEGQISAVSHEMLEDKVSEEYPDISLHDTLFHINQLLFKAYNGKFPNARVNIIDFTLKPKHDDGTAITEELVLKVFANGLVDNCVLKRLFEDQLSGEVDFPEAQHVVWELDDLGNSAYQILISEYWMDKEDFSTLEFEGEIADEDD